MAIDFEKINDSPHLLDILIQMEDVLDSLDIYVFANWMKGEVVEGPIVRRYWFDFTLRYPIDKMPDPRGAMRLLKHGVRVDFNKVTVETEAGEEPVTENEDGENEPTATHWEVMISVPKRLVADMNAAELDFYDEDIEIEDVQDAQDTGMNDETGMYDDDGEGTEDVKPEQMTDDEEPLQ
jgi:hypothetical protein